MSKQVESQGWYQASHQQIYDTAQKFDTSRPTAEAKPFHDHANEMSAEVTAMGKTIQGVVTDDWRGKAAQAMQAEYNKFFHDVDNYVQRMHEFGDKLPPVEPHIQAAKNIPAPMSALQEATLRGSLGGAGKSRQDVDAAVAKKREEDQDFARYQMTGQFSEPVVSNGSNANMDDTPPAIIEHGKEIFEGKGGGGQNGGGGSQNPSSSNNLANSLADKNTKPAFSDGSGSQSGQGQGAGSGGGSGAGGGSPQSGSGGSGSGLGNALSGLAGGLGKDGSGLAPGNTTAAGFGSPSGSGAGSGTGTLGGPGALRGGAGVPGPGGAGTNAAGIGGAGVRGGAMGMGGMGMAPMGGAHGRGGKGEDDDEHQTPEFLINWDNGNELFGDLPKASPGVIGDWSEHERAEKQRRESEKRRYKSMGWNVDFGDDD
ncbi:WXG100 family type VII secretion target [Mycobacteroides chelonae]|uniref:WXG100 family type VII secretion target n=1 Tax=Mycobacteroides chelonae TaxID=1774 RepID=UPI000992B505|nr:WXG100 family type VII secretion target [Mycobacteroides chelonae]